MTKGKKGVNPFKADKAEEVVTKGKDKKLPFKIKVRKGK